MNNVILKVAKRQKYELIQCIKLKITPRDALAEISARISSPLVKVIMGPRRCGKSTLALHSLKDRSFAYLNFEDEGIPGDITGDDIIAALDKVYDKPEVYFFDEIQNMHRWEQFIHRLHREGKNCLITGSNAHLLSSELASALTGRHVAIELLPFSYLEYLASGNNDSLDAFGYYMEHGGFPQVVLNHVDSTSYLSTLWDSVVLKDVVQRHGVRNVAGLNDIYGLLLNAVASRFNYDSLARSQGGNISSPTIKNFLRYAKEAYLLVELEQFHFATRKRIKSDRKIYTYDNGFINSKRVEMSPDKGRFLENLVFIELMRRGNRPNVDMFYYVTATGYEVDFLIRKDGKSQELFQVSWRMSEQKTRERELRALRSAAKELQVSKVKILTYSQSETIKEQDLLIEVLPVREWMVGKN